MTSRTVSSEAIKILDEIANTPAGKSIFQRTQIAGLQKVLASPLAKEIDGYVLFFADIIGRAPRSLPTGPSENHLKDDILTELWTVGTKGVDGLKRGSARLAGLINQLERSGKAAKGPDTASALREKLENLRELYGRDMWSVRRHHALMQNTLMQSGVLKTVLALH